MGVFWPRWPSKSDSTARLGVVSSEFGGLNNSCPGQGCWVWSSSPEQLWNWVVSSEFGSRTTLFCAAWFLFGVVRSEFGCPNNSCSDQGCCVWSFSPNKFLSCVVSLEFRSHTTLDRVIWSRLKATFFFRITTFEGYFESKTQQVEIFILYFIWKPYGCFHHIRFENLLQWHRSLLKLVLKLYFSSNYEINTLFRLLSEKGRPTPFPEKIHTFVSRGGLSAFFP